jgi:hypothetical protein
MIKYNPYKQLPGRISLAVLHAPNVISWCIDQGWVDENENNAKGID